MIRILIYLLLLAAAAYGADWLLQRPGHIDVTWAGYHITTSAAVGFALIVLIAIVLMVVWSILRFIFGFPSFVAMASRHRRREKGYAALSRGLIAAGAGDARAASRASVQASKHLRDDPLALVLRAQAARLTGDGARAEAAYGELAQRDDTRILGLRGLHDEAHRRGDAEAARHFAGEAYRDRALPWSAQTVLEHRAAEGDWQKALATVETSVAAKLVDRETGDRQRAVLETAIGLAKEATAPDEALALARAAMKRAPDLVPAIVLTARLLTRRGDIRKAAKLIEAAWPRCPHPELARAYLDVRPGDSTSDRLARANTLMRISSFDPISRMTVARTALGAKNFAAAREAMAPVIAEGKRPTVRACLLMADLEDAEFGDLGQWREWLARASRAPLDPAWIADGIVYDQWEPVSPTTGRLDAFVWQAPADRPGHTMEAMPAPVQPRREALERRSDVPLPSEAPQAALEHHEAPAEPAGGFPGHNGAGTPAGKAETPAKEWAAPEPLTPIAGTDGDNDSEAIIAVPVAPTIAPPAPRPFMRSVIVAPDDPGIDLPREAPAKAAAPQREDLTTSG
ncbi:heme biosynthesis protein HemY [Beijerinckia sp. L45]|uniref:heme biosynthesis protein HemY n=1 Tax=Beijerinckia sp. L45 TaxID=1641855 RepID=UPI00131A9909|nr:heme biosynthesis HemY N-terminal domain-containing protein [Beijerinckia sp. L45]